MPNETDKPQRDRMGCWRCGSHEVGWLDSIVKLFGEYRAKLCPPCLNDYQVMIREHPFFRELRSIEIKINLAFWKTSHDGIPRESEIEYLHETLSEVNKKLFAHAETWCDDVIERPTPPSPPPPTEEEISELRARRRKRLEAQLEVMRQQDEEARLVDEKLNQTTEQETA